MNCITLLRELKQHFKDVFCFYFGLVEFNNHCELTKNDMHW